jgi:hypothetical protein
MAKRSYSGTDVNVMSTSSRLLTDHTFLTAALDGSEWSASRPDHFTSGERDG